MNQKEEAAPDTSDRCNSAISYAARGWYVFPAVPGEKKSYKSKAHSNGQNWGKTTDPDEIRADFARWPMANVGIATGTESDIFVVDVDTLEGHSVDGLAAIKALEEVHGPLPVTLMAESPTGSQHYYFKWPGTTIQNKTTIAPGIDVRGEGGMVIAPSSVTALGTYKWLNAAPLADAPPWLVALATKGDSNTPHVSSDEPEADLGLIAAALAVIPNDDLDWESWNNIGMATWRATSGKGFAAFDLWSQKSKKYNARETLRRWNHYYAHPPTRIGAGTIVFLANKADPRWETAYYRSLPDINNLDPNNEWLTSIGFDTEKLANDNATEGEKGFSTNDDDAKADGRITPIELFWPGEEAADEGNWRIKGLVPEVGIGLLAARRGAGKTFVAIDLSYTLARLKAYISKPIVENIGTLWIARETPGQIPLRLRGLPEEPGCWPFRYIKTCPPLLDTKGRTNRKSVDDIIATLKVANEQMIERFGIPIGFVPIDTMRKAAGYGDRGENDPSQTGNVMQALSDIAEETRTFVLGIDHMGHDTSRGARGGTSKEDDADLVLYLNGEHGKGKMIVEKVRNGIDGIVVEYECIKVELGLDRDGDPVTTCSVELGGPEHAEQVVKLGPNQRRLLTMLQEAGPNGLTEDDWRNEAKKAGVGRQRFYDTSKSLKVRGLVSECGDRWLVVM